MLHITVLTPPAVCDLLHHQFHTYFHTYCKLAVVRCHATLLHLHNISEIIFIKSLRWQCMSDYTVVKTQTTQRCCRVKVKDRIVKERIKGKWKRIGLYNPHTARLQPAGWVLTVIYKSRDNISRVMYVVHSWMKIWIIT